MTIKEYMTQDHQDCDEAFANMEEIASKESLSATKELFEVFTKEMEHHFQVEERVLFVMFEQKTGMTQGPTEVMRQEHQQLRALMQQMSDAISADDKERLFGISETFMIMVQQHNMKEEQMLYTMIQQHLGSENAQILEMLESMISN